MEARRAMTGACAEAWFTTAVLWRRRVQTDISLLTLKFNVIIKRVKIEWILITFLRL
jgi:hypothetical protein